MITESGSETENELDFGRFRLSSSAGKKFPQQRCWLVRRSLFAMPESVSQLIAARRAAGDGPGARDDGSRLALVIEGGGMCGAITGGMALALEDD